MAKKSKKSGKAVAKKNGKDMFWGQDRLDFVDRKLAG